MQTPMPDATADQGAEERERLARQIAPDAFGKVDAPGWRLAHPMRRGPILAEVERARQAADRIRAALPLQASCADLQRACEAILYGASEADTAWARDTIAALKAAQEKPSAD